MTSLIFVEEYVINTLSNDIFVDQSDQEGTISIIGEKVTKTILLVNNVLVLIYFAIVTWKKKSDLLGNSRSS